MSFEAEMAFTKSFHPKIKRLIGHYMAERLMDDATAEQDMNEATDVVVGKRHIACRIRRAKLIERYGNEFTIRNEVKNGGRTELEKIVDGCGDWYFYGFGDTAGKLVRWFIGDLNVFRAWWFPGSGTVGRSDRYFVAFNLFQLPRDFVLIKNWQDTPTVRTCAAMNRKGQYDFQFRAPNATWTGG